MFYTPTLLLAKITGQGLCDGCKTKLGKIHIDCSDCGPVYWCNGCVIDHLIVLHNERDSLAEMLTNAVDTAIEHEEKVSELRVITSDAKLTKLTGQLTARDVLLAVSKVVKPLTDAAEKHRSKSA